MPAIPIVDADNLFDDITASLDTNPSAPIRAA